MERYRRLQGRSREARQALHGELQEVRRPGHQGGYREWSTRMLLPQALDG
jgi:hypothetical protein